METKDVGRIVVGFILTLIGIGFHIFEPNWIINPSGAGGAFIGAGVVLILITYREVRLKDKGTIVEDERISYIAEKASHKTLVILIILQGTLIAFLGVTASNIEAYPIISALFVITMISYAGFYYWYKRQM